MNSSVPRFNQITMQVAVPPGQVDAFKATMQQWMQRVPTMYFLDICAIGHIKEHVATKRCKDERQEESIRALRDLDLPSNDMSYLAALMEKASDQRSRFASAEEFVVEARRDWDAMGAFFRNARVVEPWDFVESYATDLFGHHPEQMVPVYLAFLEFANAQGLHNRIAEKNRFKTARVLCAKALELGVSTSHPVVLVSVACVYGCKDAQGVMNFSAKAERFNPGNALGDIQSISRVGLLTDLIRRAGLSGGVFKNGKFLTADSPLFNLLRYITVKSVDTMELSDGAAHSFVVSVHAPGLYPDLFGADGEPKKEKQAEIESLYQLLGV